MRFETVQCRAAAPSEGEEGAPGEGEKVAAPGEPAVMMMKIKWMIQTLNQRERKCVDRRKQTTRSVDVNMAAAAAAVAKPAAAVPHLCIFFVVLTLKRSKVAAICSLKRSKAYNQFFPFIIHGARKKEK